MKKFSLIAAVLVLAAGVASAENDPQRTPLDSAKYPNTFTVRGAFDHHGGDVSRLDSTGCFMYLESSSGITYRVEESSLGMTCHFWQTGEKVSGVWKKGYLFIPYVSPKGKEKEARYNSVSESQ